MKSSSWVMMWGDAHQLNPKPEPSPTTERRVSIAKREAERMDADIAKISAFLAHGDIVCSTLIQAHMGDGPHRTGRVLAIMRRRGLVQRVQGRPSLWCIVNCSTATSAL